jgi:hypothetical protein
MKKSIVCFIMIIGLSAFCPVEQGTYRWDYKILIDADGLKLFTAKASPSTIHDLEKLTRPAPADLKNQRAALENQKVTITGYIVDDGEEPDGDFHLVVQGSPASESLIVEIPDPNMPKLKGFPGLKSKYTAGRNFVTQNIDPHPSTIKPCPNGKVKVTITGIVFFDKIAHGDGHADNGVEIHPVLEIRAAK